MCMKNNFVTITDMSKQLKVGRDSLRRFINYCEETQAYTLPEHIRGPYNAYIYTKEDSEVVMNLFKNKKHGEMAEYNIKHWGGTKRKRKITD